jgi:Leucine-rich repeat (LRR) protein
LGRNALTEIPVWVGEMQTLRRLDLEGNKISALPSEIGLLKQLQWLRVDGNTIPTAERKRIRGLLPDCQIIF